MARVGAWDGGKGAQPKRRWNATVQALSPFPKHIPGTKTEDEVAEVHPRTAMVDFLGTVVLVVAVALYASYSATNMAARPAVSTFETYSALHDFEKPLEVGGRKLLLKDLSFDLNVGVHHFGTHGGGSSPGSAVVRQVWQGSAESDATISSAKLGYEAACPDRFQQVDFSTKYSCSALDESGLSPPSGNSLGNSEYGHCVTAHMCFTDIPSGRQYPGLCPAGTSAAGLNKNDWFGITVLVGGADVSSIRFSTSYIGTGVSGDTRADLLGPPRELVAGKITLVALKTKLLINEDDPAATIHRQLGVKSTTITDMEPRSSIGGAPVYQVGCDAVDFAGAAVLQLRLDSEFEVVRTTKPSYHLELLGAISGFFSLALTVVSALRRPFLPAL
jgi:hypothetical protein